MANKKAPKPTFQFKGYVPFTLSAADKREYLKWREKVDISWIFQQLDLLTKAGYAFRISWSDDRVAYISQLQCVSSVEQPDAVGYILSSFAPNTMDAVLLTLYKHSIILKGIWMMGASEGIEQWG